MEGRKEKRDTLKAGRQAGRKEGRDTSKGGKAGVRSAFLKRVSIF
jgi:hypothetical protein